MQQQNCEGEAEDEEEDRLIGSYRFTATDISCGWRSTGFRVAR
jgi:hypothetical protein